jgi:hypothetical protein
MNTLVKSSFCSGALLLVWTATLNASPDRHHRDDFDRRPDRSPSVSISLGLPDGYVSLSVGNDRFYEYRGTFYRPGPGGYVVTRAPRGAILPTLPPGCVRIYTGNVLYFRFGDVYYRQAPAGYVIVDAPVIEKQPPVSVAESYQSVWIGDVEYQFKDGQFFRRTADGLVWTPAPLGAVTKTLPSDAKSIWYQDVEYFESDSIYFRKTPDGYKVVTAPWKS